MIKDLKIEIIKKFVKMLKSEKMSVKEFKTMVM